MTLMTQEQPCNTPKTTPPSAQKFSTPWIDFNKAKRPKLPRTSVLGKADQRLGDARLPAPS
jgi:hypothetical protein